MDTTELEVPDEDWELGEGIRLYRPTPIDSPERPDVPHYILYFDLLDELRFAARYRERPSVALLTGRRSPGGASPLIELTGFVGYQYVSGPEGWYDPVRGSLEQHHEDPRAPEVMGVFTSLSGTEGGMTPEIIHLHTSLFNRPDQIALVLDPHALRLGLYLREEGGRCINVPVIVAYRRDDREASREEERGASSSTEASEDVP